MVFIEVDGVERDLINWVKIQLQLQCFDVFSTCPKRWIPAFCSCLPRLSTHGKRTKFDIFLFLTCGLWLLFKKNKNKTKYPDWVRRIHTPYIIILTSKKREILIFCEHFWIYSIKSVVCFSFKYFHFIFVIKLNNYAIYPRESTVSHKYSWSLEIWIRHTFNSNFKQ